MSRASRKAAALRQAVSFPQYSRGIALLEGQRHKSPRATYRLASLSDSRAPGAPQRALPAVGRAFGAHRATDRRLAPNRPTLPEIALPCLHSRRRLPEVAPLYLSSEFCRQDL